MQDTTRKVINEHRIQEIDSLGGSCTCRYVWFNCGGIPSSVHSYGAHLVEMITRAYVAQWEDLRAATQRPSTVLSAEEFDAFVNDCINAEADSRGGLSKTIQAVKDRVRRAT